MPVVSGYSDLLRDLLTAGMQPMSNKDIAAWLSARIKERLPFISVGLAILPISAGRRPDPKNVVILADSDQHPRTTKADEVRFYGRQLVLADLRPLTWDYLTGTVHQDIAHGESALLIRIRENWGIVWIKLKAGAELFTEEMDRNEWAEAIAIFVRLTVRLAADPPQPDTEHERRQKFYQHVLQLCETAELWDDLGTLCNAWHTMCGASWVWMWLYNPLNRKFELSAASTDAPEINRDLLPDRCSACDYCAKTMKPLFVTDARSWRKSLGDETYEVSCASHMEHLGALLFDAVPLLPSPAPPKDSDPQGLNPGAAGVLTLHYQKRSQRLPQPPSSLLIMGRLTMMRAHATRNQRGSNVIQELNRLAQKHLVEVHKKQAEVRREYLKDVIALIKKFVDVESLSIFFRRENANAVECIATTGLWDMARDRYISEDDPLSDIVYEANEGWTGTCFASAKPIVRSIEERIDSPKYADIVDDEQIKEGMILQHPIPQDDKKALGVIRCSGHRHPKFRHDRGFDAMDIKLIGFIAQQLAPVLETIASRIKREREISYIKHDLDTPLNLIRDMTERIERQLARGKELGEYDLWNLAQGQRAASNLVDQLSVDFSKPPELDLKHTRLGAHIIARLKNLMFDYARLENHMEIYYSAIDEVIPALWIDRDLVERAIYNILVNAVKYGAPYSEITITGRSHEPGFYLDISNYGIGIGEDEKPCVFDPEYRSPLAPGKGAGLGLTISKRAIEAHGGSLRITSLRDPTTFTIFFPRALATRRPA